MLMQWGEEVDGPTRVASAKDRTPECTTDSLEAIRLEPANMVEETVSWMGPLPPPSAVREYEAILPGSCERLLLLTERQAVHRQWIEREALSSAMAVERRGQAIAAVIAVLAIVCGTYLMATNHDGWGFATVVTAIAGLVGASAFSRRLSDRDSDREDAAAVGRSG